MMHVLVIAHDARATGGVNNFLRIMRSKIRNRVHCVRFANGRRHGETGKIAAVARMLRDYMRFMVYITRNPVDVLHINPSLDLSSLPRELAFVVLCKLLSPRTKTLMFYRGWSWDALARIRGSRILYLLYRQALKRVDRFLVLSSEFKRALEEDGVASEKAFLATTMFEGDALLPVIQDAGIEAARPNISFLSRFLPAKGGSELIRAFAQVYPSFPDVRLVMAGHGPSYDEWVAIAEELGVADKVDFPGYILGAAKMRILASSEIFVLPTSHPEGMPNAILEAMASGCFIIATPIAGIVDIVIDGENGTIIAERSVPAIADALRDALVDRKKTRATGIHNYTQAWSKWESQIVSSAIATHYERLAAERVAS